MSLLLGPMRQHIPGFKELSDHKDIIEVKPGKEVSIPLFANHSQNFELLVNEGDKVYVGTKLAVCNERMTVPIYSSVSGVVKGVKKNDACIIETSKSSGYRTGWKAGKDSFV